MGNRYPTKAIMANKKAGVLEANTQLIIQIDRRFQNLSN